MDGLCHVSLRGEGLAGDHREVLDDRTEREGREEGQAANDQDHADEKPDEQSAMGWEGARRGRDAFSSPPSNLRWPWPG